MQDSVTSVIIKHPIHLVSSSYRLIVVFNSSFFFTFLQLTPHCHVYLGDWLTLTAGWHRPCPVLRCDVVTSLLQSVTPSSTPHRDLLRVRGYSWRVSVVCTRRPPSVAASRFAAPPAPPAVTVGSGDVAARHVTVRDRGECRLGVTAVTLPLRDHFTFVVCSCSDQLAA